MKEESGSMQYNTIICGGTFDRLHDGHKHFLRKIFSLGNRVLIGLTSDSYVGGNKKGNIQPFQERLEQLKTFLAKEGLLIRAEVFPIQDVYGKALDESLPIDCIMVTQATQNGAEEINTKRKELGLSELPIHVIPLIKHEGPVALSSTNIREGQVGRQGEIYLDDKWTKHILVLPAKLREVLHQPFHTLMTGPIPRELVADPSRVVTVGDATTKRFNQEEIGQNLSIIDFSVERKSLFHTIKDLGFSGDEEILDSTNAAGQIDPPVWEVLQKAIEESKRNKIVVHVTGEEDLLVIPLVLLLPLGWRIFYGQPKEGVVYVPVTEEVKKKVYDFLVQFVRK